MELAQAGEFVGLAGLGACGVAGGNDGQAGEKGIEHRGYRVCDELFDAAALADEFAEDAELAVGGYLFDDAGGCQTEVEAEVDGVAAVDAEGLVLYVFGCGVGFVGKDSALRVEEGQECAGLSEEDPAVGFDFFGLAVPPVVIVRRFFVENHAGPDDLSGFVDPYAGQFQRQQQ